MANSLAQKISRILADLFAGTAALSNRNYLVDGAFEQCVNPTGLVSGVGAVISPFQMFFNGAGTSGVCSVSQPVLESSVFVPGMTSPAKYCMFHQQTTAASVSPVIAQHIESALTLHGRSATFSCWLWTNTPGGIVVPSVAVSQYMGTGGSPSAAPAGQTIAVNWALTATPKRFSLRLDLPSLTGLTLGTSNNDYVNLNLNLPVGSTFNVITSQWQLEACSPQAPSTGVPTAYEYRGQQAELARTQRYYNRTVCIVGATANQQQMAFPVSMRMPPALTATFDAGTGGAFLLSGGGVSAYYQNTAHSLVATATVTADARL